MERLRARLEQMRDDVERVIADYATPSTIVGPPRTLYMSQLVDLIATVRPRLPISILCRVELSTDARHEPAGRLIASVRSQSGSFTVHSWRLWPLNVKRVYFNGQ